MHLPEALPAPWPCSPRSLPWPKVFVLVIILTFVVVLAMLGYAPAVAIGVVVIAVTAASNPGAARASLGILALPGATDGS